MTAYPPRVLTQRVAPAFDCVTLAETKLFLRIDGSEEDSLISHLIKTGSDVAESWLRRSLITQEWEMEQQYQQGSAVMLGLPPVTSVIQVKLIYSTQETLLNETEYRVSADLASLTIDKSHRADRVLVIYEAGYGDANEVPTAIKQGILHQIAALYHHREDGANVTKQAKQLWAPYRVSHI